MPEALTPRTPTPQTHGTLTPDDVIAAAVAAEAALRPLAGRDWSVRAGPLEWDVGQTVTHMLAATAKYTLYLASRCEHFIGLSVTRWPDATNEEVIDSVVPVATGLAAVAAATPASVRAYHATGPSSPSDYVGRACVELLVHTDDALAGLGVPFAPTADLCQRVLARQFPDAAGPGNPANPANSANLANPWHRLLEANGRPVRQES